MKMKVRCIGVLLILCFLIPNSALSNNQAMEKYMIEERHQKIIEAIKLNHSVDNIKQQFFDKNELSSGIHEIEIMNAYEDFFHDYPLMISSKSKSGFESILLETKELNILMRAISVNEIYLKQEMQLSELNRILDFLDQRELDDGEKYLIGNYLYRLPEGEHKKKLKDVFEKKYLEVAQFFKSGAQDLKKSDVRELFYHLPDWSSVADGKYRDSVKLFVFCRKNRDYPCFILAKDQFDLPIVDENGDLWGQPALAASSRGLPSSMRNGQTPTGVQTIDSVMPYNNRQEDFGKFRRLILNWTPKISQTGELEIMAKQLLPAQIHEQKWWRESLISRDVGRTDLRIHGTGRMNPEPNSSHYPFRKSSGCITQREGRYPEGEYVDQRKILDVLMSNLGFNPNYENETQIKGVLYLVELDNQQSAVTKEELARLLLD